MQHGLNSANIWSSLEFTYPQEVDLKSRKPRYEVKNGILSIPVKEEYIFVYTLLSYVSANTTLAKKIQDFTIRKTFSTLEEVKTFILTDEDYITNFLTKIDYEMSWSDTVTYEMSIDFYDIPDAKNKPFLEEKKILEKSTALKSEEIKKLVESSELYEKCVTRFKAEEDKRKKDFEDSELERTATIQRNNYEMWKVLDAKRKAGEFNDFDDFNY
jgi:hypothetical protein